jgi:hypothetical protein
MPPKLNHTSNHHTADPDNEVVCPIKSADGSNCRKKCLGVRLPISSLCFCFVSQSSTALLSSTVLSRIPAVVVPCTMLSRLPRNSSLHAAMLRRTGSSQDGNATYKGIIGEAFPLDAGAYPTSASRILHSKVAGNQGKLRLDDQLTTV